MNESDFNKAAKEFFQKENERAVDELQEALHIQKAMDLLEKYLKEGLIRPEMPLIEALEIIEKRKLKLADFEPEEPEEE